MIRKLLIVGFAFLAVFNVKAQTVNEIQKIISSDRQKDDRFGQSIDVDGDYIVVGAPLENHDAVGGANKGDAGAAYIFKNNGGTWVQIQKIVASDRNNNDQFGSSVAISGEYLVVGASDEDHNEVGALARANAGSAYIFKNDGSDNWAEVQKIVASDRDNADNFAHTIAMDGEHIVVGAKNESAYVFENQSGTWVETSILTASDGIASDGFGISVSISGSNIIVGANQEDENAAGSGYAPGAGSAYVFEKQVGSWVQVQKIVASDREINDNFGNAVAISGSQLVVGAYYEDDDISGANDISGAGSAYVFENIGGTWTEELKLVAADRAMDDNFGNAVAISSDLVTIGSMADGDGFTGDSGAVYIYEKIAGDWEGKKIISSDRDAFHYYGNAVAISGETVLVGEFNESGAPFSFSNEGAAYIYEVERATCTQTLATIDTTVCGSVTINAETYSTDGSFIQLLTNAGDCDSVLTINVTIASAINVNLTETSCGGYTLNGQTYTSTGLYSQTLTASNGCDSIVNLDLTVNNPTSSNLTETACSSYMLNGQSYTTTGVYMQTVTGANGCDSTINLDLTINEPVNVDLTEESCEDYTLNGQTYTSTGVYTQTLMAANGCDSIINLDLTINEPITVNLTEQSCDDYTLNGQTYTTTGVYMQTLTGSNGCDSILNLDLTISGETTINLTESSCGDYTLNGQTYSTTGLYTQTLTSSGGCDSIINLDLTISSEIMVDLTEVSCGSYTLNGQTYSSTGMYSQTLTSSGGCDSIINLDLTINQPVSVIVVQEACDDYTLNGQTYTETGTYQQILVGNNGCDSIVNLNLTISSIDDEVVLTGATLKLTEMDASYQWIDCDNGNKSISGANGQEYSPSVTGSFAAIVTKGTCIAVTACTYVDLMITGEVSGFGELGLSLYPNPTSQSALLEFSDQGVEYLVNVYSNTGVLMSSQVVSNSTEVNVDGVAGMYTLEVINIETNAKEVLRLIKN